MNSLADLSSDEYKNLYLGLAVNPEKLLSKSATPFRYADVPEESLPKSIDWRAKGAVAEVKNQQQCGSCWAFSTTGSIEGINAIFTGQLISLSEQELVDCDTAGDNQGCNGGLMDSAFEFVISNGGLDTEEDYPYTGTDGRCIRAKKGLHVVSIDGYEDVPAKSMIALKKAVAHQPVSVAIEADQRSFQLYAGGVYNDTKCGTALDHGVLAVGYGVEHGQYYWIVKNSWGPDWGDKGYIKMAMGSQFGPSGICGIQTMASYPVKNSPNPSPTPSPTPSPRPSPSPSPSPSIKCDDFYSCPVTSTCCCTHEIFGICLTWSCCPTPNAVCCEGSSHCCPSDRPVCNADDGTCSKTKGDASSAQPWLTKFPAHVMVTPEAEDGPGPDPTPAPHPHPRPHPQPVECDADHQCPPETTCCCLDSGPSFAGSCNRWGCCPDPAATCCDDNLHCCPHTLPVCDTDRGACLPQQGLLLGAQPWLSRFPAQRKADARGRLTGVGEDNKSTTKKIVV
jgi:KDEL-tailed cysteine endopeptidase